MNITVERRPAHVGFCLIANAWNEASSSAIRLSSAEKKGSQIQIARRNVFITLTRPLLHTDKHDILLKRKLRRCSIYIPIKCKLIYRLASAHLVYGAVVSSTEL